MPESPARELLAEMETAWCAMHEASAALRADLNAFLDVALPHFEKTGAPRYVADAARDFSASLRVFGLRSDACHGAMQKITERI